MERSPTSSLLSWILVPVAAYLVLSALSSPQRVYTGLVLKGDYVGSVDPGSPGERAGLLAGDRLRLADNPSSSDPLQTASPGTPLTLVRQRGHDARPAWLAPEPLPPRERRLAAGLLVAAAAFITLGGWVWSERRDPLTRAFFLLCVSFGALLAPKPVMPGAAATVAWDVMTTAITLYLPALFVHFFATFPESRAQGRRHAWIRAFYMIATALFVVALAANVAVHIGLPGATTASDALQVAAAVWFAMGLLAALALFFASYQAAGSPDARRRLRVALIGTLLGVLPFAGLIVLRTVSPGTILPGERWAVGLTLLVPASFAWATVVHRVFDFRVALRGAVAAITVTAACAGLYLFGEWWTLHWGAGTGADLSGGALALVAVAASMAGPASPLVRSLGRRVVPDDDTPALATWLHEHAAAAPPGVAVDAEALLAEACATLARVLRLDGCGAIVPHGDGTHVVGAPGIGLGREPGPELRARTLRVGGTGAQGVHETSLARADQEALALAGVAWLLPVGEPPRALLLLGRRLAGSWLSRREGIELDRFARQLGVALENAALRREASSHGALARELREAGRVQAHLLPHRVPVHPTLDCAAAVLSTEPVGGDYYDFVEGTDRTFTLAVGDVAGHGLPAALLVSHVQAQFRNQAGGDTAPSRILDRLNRSLVQFDQPQKFVGLVCARVDVRRGRVSIANAGLTPPLVRRADGRIEEIETSGVLLGVRRESEYRDVMIELAAGDALVVYTDGLTEAQRGDELFGADRLKALVAHEGRRRAVDLMEAMLREVRAYADQPLDDLTVVVLRQLTSEGAGAALAHRG